MCIFLVGALACKSVKTATISGYYGDHISIAGMILGKNVRATGSCFADEFGCP